MRHYRFSVDVAAPQEQVFDLWLNLDRLHEWIEAVTKVTDINGRPDEAGSRYVVWFGPMRSPTEVLVVERPRLVKTRGGHSLLRGEMLVTFERVGEATRVTQELWTQGLIPAVAARILATGSYKGSFRGELNAFARIAEREAHGRTGGHDRKA